VLTHFLASWEEPIQLMHIRYIASLRLPFAAFAALSGHFSRSNCSFVLIMLLLYHIMGLKQGELRLNVDLKASLGRCLH